MTRLIVALTIQRHLSGDVLTGLAEPDTGERGHQRRCGGGAAANSMNSTPLTWTRRGIGGASWAAWLLAADLIHQVDQRAMAIDGDRTRRCRRGTVVEDLEAEPAIDNRWRRPR